MSDLRPKSPEDTVTRRLSQLRNAVLELRCMGCFVYPIGHSFGLWVFSTSPDFEALAPVCSHQNDSKTDLLIVKDAHFQSMISSPYFYFLLFKFLSHTEVAG